MIAESQFGQSMRTTLEHVMGRLVEDARADAVFGHPVERGDTTVIPCSEVAVGLGVGGGGGAGGDRAQVSRGAGEGMGGGGGARGRPVAIVVVSPQRVRVQPIVDVTRVALAMFATLAFALAWLAWLGRAAGVRPGARKLTPMPVGGVPRPLRRLLRRRMLVGLPMRGR